MPTYDYRCEACAHEFEEVQSFSADPLKTCPKCGQDRLRRLFGTGAAILFKGGGFYETDYKRGEGYKKAEQAESGSKPAEAKPAESKPAPSANGTPSSGGSSTPAKADGSGKKDG
jgi:putative FmdB family regulatory protein